MSYAISRDINTAAYRRPVKHQSFVSVFFQWSARQDADHHIAWAGISMLATTAVFFPLTMASIVLNGAAFPLIITAMVALVLVVVLNLAAMPTQYTIPAFVLGIFIDAGLITTSVLMH